jgi:TRAP-type C4-dicarboxylate transport system permease small subunit
MNADLIVALVGILIGVVAFVPALVGEKAVERFGSRVGTAAKRMGRAVRRVGEYIVTTLLLFAFIIVIIVVLDPTNPSLTPWSSSKHIEESLDLTVTILKWTGIFAGGLVALAIVVAAVCLVLWIFAQLLAVVPVGPQSVAGIALILTVGVSLAGYVVARSDAGGACAHRTAASPHDPAGGDVDRPMRALPGGWRIGVGGRPRGPALRTSGDEGRRVKYSNG